MSNKNLKSYNAPSQGGSPQGGVAMSVFILSLVLSFVMGIIGGFFIGENRAESKISNLAINTPSTQNGNNQNGGTQNGNTQKPTEDYSKYVINKTQNVTIDNFYQDAETKGYAKNLIGQSMPKLTWTDKDGKQRSTDELGSTYIVEMFSLTCTYCQATIPEITKFRTENPNIPIVSLTPDQFKEGAIDKFNASGEHAFYWTAKDTGSELLMTNMPWVPGFLFVQDGKIKLVSYGGTDAATLKKYVDIATTN